MTTGGHPTFVNSVFANNDGAAVHLDAATDTRGAMLINGTFQTGSPATDAGSNDVLPPDLADLDSDMDTVEPPPLDAGWGPRVIDGGVSSTVDMGAFEYAP